MQAPLLTVVYAPEPDIVFEFRSEGESRNFGRDDRCDIVVWSALNQANLSRLAGSIWRMDGELWLRNHSLRHELHIRVHGMPPEQPLRPRRSEASRGEARSIPAPAAEISGPDGCELHVRQIQSPPQELFTFGLPEPTMPAVPEIPVALRPTAAALCEPLLRGGHLPASYREVMTRLGEPSLKTVRRLVGELCEHYAQASPALRQRVVERLLREQEQLGIPHDPRLRAGIWTFGQSPAPYAGKDSEAQRRRSLVLPEYVEVARMLVSHFRVNAADVAALPSREGAP